MSHVPYQKLHVYSGRGLPLTIGLITTLDADDLTNTRFNCEKVTKSSLTVTDTANGISIDIPFTNSDLDIPPGIWEWELLADINTAPTSLMYGSLIVDPAPTIE